MKDIIKQELQQASDVLNKFMADEVNIQTIWNAADVMRHAIKYGKKVISCGNGGSMADAMHFASELTGRYRHTRRPFKAMAISDPCYISCVANDFGYENIFHRWIMAFGEPGDVLLAISTSGQSENIIKAIHAAHDKDMHIVFLTGKEGGSVRPILDINDIEINVDHIGYADRIQECHIKIIHILVHLIEQGI